MTTTITSANAAPLRDRVAALDWSRIEGELDARGFALTGRLLESAEGVGLKARYDDESLYRSRVVMSRHGFGSGEYKYYEYPLPEVVASLREAIYPRLVPVANRWAAALGHPTYPATLPEMVERCRAGGQSRPTPLILRYTAGDYNCLHQDVYGETLFPIQLTILLSDAERDFDGGDFVLVEQRPRKQSRAEVVRLGAGEGVLFAVSARPVQGTRGIFRATMRHGVATIQSGERLTLGIIFHEAR